MQEIADHDVEARDAHGVALRFEQRPRAFGRCQSLVITANEHERLKRGTQGSGELGVVLELLERGNRLDVMLDRELIVAAHRERVRLRACAQREQMRVADLVGDRRRLLGTRQRAMEVDAQQLSRLLDQALRLRLVAGAGPLHRRRGNGYRHRPIPSRADRRRSRQRLRRKPIDPVATPSADATSLYGRDRRLEEQHLHHALAAVRQRGNGITECLRLLHFANERVRHVGLWRRCVLGVSAFVRHVAIVAAPPLRHFVQRRLNEPGRQGLRIAQAGKLRDEIEAHGLEDVGGFVAGEALLERNREDQPVIAVDQLAPRLLVA